jgi:hypothetical protein
MKNIYKLFILFAFFFVMGCSSNNNDSNISEGTLKDYYDYWDKINNEDLHLIAAAQEYYHAFGTNDQATIKAALEKFQAAQKRGIELVLQKFPKGAIQFPFEQSGIDAYVQMKSIYISGYAYPWVTAERNSFYVTFEYDYKKADLRFKSVRAEFYDTRGDIINACNLTLNKSGKTEIYMKPEIEFKKFLKIKIVSSEI